MSERLYRRTEQRMSYGWDGDDLFDTLVRDGWLVPVEPGRLIDRAIEYHDAMRTSLTDSEDHRNHAANILRYALDLPLGNVTGQIDDEHWAFIHRVTRRRR